MLKFYQSVEKYLEKHKTSAATNPRLTSQVSQIIEDVKQRGDRAVMEFTEKFDGIVLESLRVPEEAIAASMENLDKETKELFQQAINNVRNFHQKQYPHSWLEERQDGSLIGMQYTPIERIGVYVPGGTAGYPSTVIMTVVPAQIAGVERIVLVSPPAKNGSVNSRVLAVAGLSGIKEVYAIGGAQAIAALAYGTESVPEVDKIVGPGNAYVNEAKRQVFGSVGIDALAGPTEVVILADALANPEFIVRDLFAQAEHDTEARAVFVTPARELANNVRKQAKEYMHNAARKEILQSSLEKFGVVVLVNDLKEGIQLVNKIAPEHVQIMTQNPNDLVTEIHNAGAIFLGKYTPVVVGDYFAGSNHVLPTAANARFSSPLSVLDFMKFSSVVKYSKTQLKNDGSKISKFAELEGLINHKNAIECRYE